MEKYACLLFGPDAKLENIAAGSFLETPPFREAFLGRVKKEVSGKKTAFAEFPGYIQDIMEEIWGNEETKRQNFQNVSKGTAVKSKTALNKDKIAYHSIQLSGSCPKRSCGKCLCRVSFGGDASHSTHPTSATDYTGGKKIQKIFFETLQSNADKLEDKQPGSAPSVYLGKAFHIVGNAYDHKENHGIDAHADTSPTYSNLNPITSLNWGAGGLIVFTPKSRSAQKSEYADPPPLLVYQHQGDALIMGGDFQDRCLHEVPPRCTWEAVVKDHHEAQLRSKSYSTISQIARNAVFNNLKTKGRTLTEPLFRYNMTIRWHQTHQEFCRFRTGSNATGGPHSVKTGSQHLRLLDDVLIDALAGSSSSSTSSLTECLTRKTIAIGRVTLNQLK